MPSTDPQEEKSKQSSTDLAWTPETEAAFESKSFSKHLDPCQELANKSIKCLHRNAGNKDLCNDYFQAYRDCKKAWVEARKEAKKKEGKSWFNW